MDLYLLLKALHVVSVIFWMAGMLYLPRLFVYHSSKVNVKEVDEVFKIMESRLLRIIIRPAMIASLFFGIGCLHFVGFPAWLGIKILILLVLFGFHGFLEKTVKVFANGGELKSEKFYRLVNEIPAIAAIFIVLLAILKPF